MIFLTKYTLSFTLNHAPSPLTKAKLVRITTSPEIQLATSNLHNRYTSSKTTTTTLSLPLANLMLESQLVRPPVGIHTLSKVNSSDQLPSNYFCSSLKKQR